MKTFVIGDIHGAYKALLQCFDRSGFDHKQDRLIVIGDVCDGYLEVRQCIDELLKVKYCDLVIGNHDMWALDWAGHGIAVAGRTPFIKKAVAGGYRISFDYAFKAYSEKVLTFSEYSL